MSDLYEEDIVLWSERQGELLRRRAAGDHRMRWKAALTPKRATIEVM